MPSTRTTRASSDRWVFSLVLFFHFILGKKKMEFCRKTDFECSRGNNAGQIITHEHVCVTRGQENTFRLYRVFKKKLWSRLQGRFTASLGYGYEDGQFPSSSQFVKNFESCFSLFFSSNSWHLGGIESIQNWDYIRYDNIILIARFFACIILDFIFSDNSNSLWTNLCTDTNSQQEPIKNTASNNFAFNWSHHAILETVYSCSTKKRS